jgi:hypothetical protein
MRVTHHPGNLVLSKSKADHHGRGSIHMKLSMTRKNKDDLLIQVDA